MDKVDHGHISQGPYTSKPRYERDENPLVGLSFSGDDETASDTMSVEYNHETDTSNLLPINDDDRKHDVKDKFNFASITFLLLGLSTLMTWSFFITANDYWMYKFRNTSLPYPPPDLKDKTFLQTTYASWISIASNIPAFFALLVNTKLLRFSEGYRNGISQVIIILFFGATTVLVFINSDNWQYEFFGFTMATIVFMNIAGAIFQAGLVGLASMFPKKYMHSMITGQGLAGVFAAIAQILALLEGESPVHTAMTFFLSALAGLIVAFIAYCAVRRTRVFKYYTSLDREGFEPLNSGTNPSLSGSINLSESLTQISSFKITKQIWACALSIFITFVVTMSVFPGLTVLVVSQNASNGSLWTGRLFLPVACFFLYGVGDFCGRLACGFLPLSSIAVNSKFPSRHRGRSDYIFLLVSILRILLIPGFMLCNAHPRSGHLPILFPQDEVFIALVAILGLTNGICFCAPMIIAPVLLPMEYREKAGSVLTICLLAGLSVGSLLSFPLVSFL